MIRKFVNKCRSDCVLLIGQDPAITYFTNEFGLTYPILLMDKKGEVTLYTSELDKVRTKVGTKRFKSLKDILKSYGTVGLNYKVISAELFEKVKMLCKKVVDVSEVIEQTQAVKKKSEIEIIKKACKIADNAFRRCMANFCYKTEVEVRAAVESEILRQGAQVAFPTIVASGRNSAVPHHQTSKSRLTKGFCVIDFGARYKGYCSDCTRTIHIGKVSTKLKRHYELVLNAQQNVAQAVSEKMACSKADEIARKLLGSQNKYFTHSLGHGVGTNVHEKPNISSKSADSFKNGMVFTIEPGIYIPDKYGIRIEDTFVLQDEVKCLTNIQRELIEFK